MVDHATYEADICARRGQVKLISFRDVSGDGWHAAMAGCHDNVDDWVRRHPNDRAVPTLGSP